MRLLYWPRAAELWSTARLRGPYRLKARAALASSPT